MDGGMSPGSARSASGSGRRAGRFASRQGRRTSLIVAVVAIFGFWLVISGSLAPADLATGLVIATILGLWSAGLLWAGDPPALPLRRWPAFIAYLGRLAAYVVGAATHVGRIVFDPRVPVEPRLIRHRVALRQPLARMVFAQSVTLMPGTVTIDVRGDTFLIHCLDEHSARRILSGELERRIARVFAAGPQP
jgi:multicomponent Na+:H+ antiporter subunit E